MTSLINPFTDPILNFAAPLYHLCSGQSLGHMDFDQMGKAYHLERFILATLHTATAAAFFFTIIPFNRIFGHHDNLSGSLAFAAQFLIHPYAASLFNACINGCPLVMKVIDFFVKRQLILTRNELGECARAIAFLHLGHHLRQSHYYSYVDRKYRDLATKLAYWYYEIKT